MPRVVGTVRHGCSIQVIVRDGCLSGRIFSKDVDPGLAIRRVLSCVSISGGCD